MVLGMTLRVDLLDFHLGVRLPLIEAYGRVPWFTVCPHVWTGGLQPGNLHQSSRHCTWACPLRLVEAPASFGSSLCSAARSVLGVSALQKVPETRKAPTH